MTKLKWVKCPSVGREGRFFYYAKNRNCSVINSFLTGQWYLSENGKNSNEMFKTAKQAMKWAEMNVLH
jgi:hypothetical protein